jgi:IS30 family transposase
MDIIAAKLKRSPSTISCEIGRNSLKGDYRAIEADAMAWARAQRPKPCRLATQPLLQAVVASKLRLDWSPEQVAG